MIEDEKFYEQNKKKYILEKNKLFLKWLKEKIKNGYNVFMDIDELQDLVNNLVSWYEIKYPEREIKAKEGIIDEDFKDIEKLSKKMDFSQLLYRLSSKQLKLIKCEYRADYWGQREIKHNDQLINLGTTVFLSISRKNIDRYDITTWGNDTPYFMISADATTGKLLNTYDLGEIIDCKEITLEQLYKILKDDKQSEFDFSELTKCIKSHIVDTKLRNIILQLAALKLLFSKNTNQTIGYIRAKKLIEEFNNNLGLNLSTKEIDEIITQNYSIDDKSKHTKKSKIEQMKIKIHTIKK